MELKDWVKEKGWSVKHFAQRFDVSYPSARNWIKYNHRPSIYYAKRLAAFTEYKVSVKELLDMPGRNKT